MPIRILSLPIAVLQYALEYMDIRDLVAFSLCSKRTKHLVKSSNRKIDPISADVDEDYISFDIRAENDYNFNNDNISLYIYNSYIEYWRKYGSEIWRKEQFTQSDWIDHFLRIFNNPMIEYLGIINNSLSYLDTIKQLFPKCSRLAISDKFSREFANIAFMKLYPIAEKVNFYKNIFDDENDISKILTLNLKSLYLKDWENPLKLKLEDLLVLNITDVRIDTANITEKEMNRFLKLWMKRNHGFYRPKYLELHLRNELNREEVLRGTKYDTVDNKN